MYEASTAVVHRLQVWHRVAPAGELGQVTMLQELPEQRPVGLEDRILHLYQVAQELLGRQRRRMDMKAFFDVAPNDIRHREAVFTSMLRVHELASFR